MRDRRARLALLLAGSLALATARAEEAPDGQAPGGQAPGGQAPDWPAWDNGTGLGLRHPAGWQPAAAKEPGWVQVRGPAGERVILGPLLVPGRLDRESAAPLLAVLADKAAGGRVRWSAPRALGTDGLQVAGPGDLGLVAIASLHWAPVEENSAAMFAIVAAKAERLHASIPVFRQLLASVTLRGSGPAPTAGAPLPSFVGWADPAERAFTVEVPMGWQVEGGTFRRTAVDVRQSVRAVSPDGGAVIFLGDPELSRQLDIVPSAGLAAVGYPEGALLPTGQGPPVPIRRYLPGSSFAGAYARSHLPGMTGGRCAAVALGEARTMPDAEARLNAVYAPFRQLGMTIRSDVGLASFHCGADWSGLVLAQTELLVSATSTMQNWYLDELSGFAATRGEIAAAAAAHGHLLASFRVDPGWGERQLALTRDTSRTLAETQRQVSAMIHDAFERQAASEARNFEGFAEATRGTVTLRYPDGSEHEVWSTANYYWLAGDGTRIGTNGPAPPAEIDLTQPLETVPAH